MQENELKAFIKENLPLKTSGIKEFISKNSNMALKENLQKLKNYTLGI